MKSHFPRFLLLTSFAAGLVAASGCASVDEKTRSAAQTTNSIGNKIDSAVRRGIASGNSAADSAVKSAEGPIDRTAKKIGLPGGPPSTTTTDRTGGGN